MESATEDETSADNIESSEDEGALHQARVRDRGASSLESQKLWHMLDPENDLEHADGAHHGPKGYADRTHNARAFVKRNGASGSAKHRRRPHSEFDEGLSDDQAEEDSGRSRSRSPKRLGTESPASQQLLMTNGKDRAPSRPPRDTSPYGARGRSRSRFRKQLRAAAPRLRDPYHVDERVPLLRGRSTAPTYQAPAQPQTPVMQKMAETEAAHGKSTFWQTWFNTVNVLVGVSILSMPLAFACAGWAGGFGLFVLCGCLTNYSGKVLARIMAREPHLHTYADIGSYAFGPMIRVCISFLFCFEMWMVSVALLILMSDSMTVLVYGSGESGHATANAVLKVLGFVVVLPTLFLPLKLLSPVSLVGIVSILFLLVVITTDGLVNTRAPGSLWSPSTTEWAPQWKGIPLAFGLIMAGFSSHPVIPSLYRDMRDPSQFNQMLDLAYVTTAALYLLMAVVGYLMFGTGVSDEVTRDLARTPGLPHLLTVAAVLLVTINPMTKFALALRPVTVVLEKWAGVLEGVQLKDSAPARDEEERQSFLQSMSGVQSMTAGDLDAPPAAEGGSRSLAARAKVAAIRVGMALSVLVTAMAVPSLERVMGFLGAFLTFNSCIFGPLLANLVLAREELHGAVLWRDLLILTLTFGLAVMGTLRSIFPDW